MTTKMKAPKDTSSAVIEGHEYEIPKNGIITVKNESHIETLKRHGFIEADDDGDIEAKIDEMDDKEELVQFIEEHGGEADTSMGLKKLRRLAKESVAEGDED